MLTMRTKKSTKSYMYNTCEWLISQINLSFISAQFFTKWANTFLQHSQDQFLITDLARDLGDGLTLLSLVEMLGESPEY